MPPTEEDLHLQPDELSKSTLVRVGRETKGRGGKGVTIISDLPLDESGLAELAAKLKTRLGLVARLKMGRSRSKAISGIGSLPNLSVWATE